jgi:3-hydroxyacyl-[acyl-carrier-protein] dehydratase
MKLLNDLYSIISRTCGEGRCDFTIELNPQHFIYKAHFPGEPITPGVCIMQIAKELFEEAVSQQLTLSCVKNIKFLRIISPSEITVLDYSLTKIVTEGDTVKVQVNVLSGEDVYAKLSLVCQKAA